jgi:hypothetical protein
MTFLSTSASREIRFKELIGGDFVEIRRYIFSRGARFGELFTPRRRQGDGLSHMCGSWSFTTTTTGAIISFTVSTYPAIVKVEFYDARTLNLLRSAYYHLEDRTDHTAFFPIPPGDYIVKVFTVNQYSP